MVKPGKRDRKHGILITGLELDELRRHTLRMAESFGLDGRIDRYRGKRPIGLYRWDLECLLDVIKSATDDAREYPSRDDENYRALRNLYDRLKSEYEQSQRL